MKTKPKLVMCAAIFLVGSFVSVFLSTALHNILSGEMTTLEIAGFSDCIESITTSRQHLMLFFCLSGFMLVLAAVFFLTNMRPYQSHLNTVTPDIKTPAAVGQFQHGSAKWLTEKEKDQTFESFLLDPNDARIKELIRTGYNGLDFMKGG